MLLTVLPDNTLISASREPILYSKQATISRYASTLAFLCTSNIYISLCQDLTLFYKSHFSFSSPKSVTFQIASFSELEEDVSARHNMSDTDTL